MDTFGPGKRGAAWRLVLSLVAGTALVASAFMPWGFDHRAYNIGVDSLVTAKATVRASFMTSLGLVVLILGVVALLGLFPRRGWLTTVAGIGGVIIASEFALTHLIDADFARSELNFGWYLILLSAVAVPAAWVGTRPESMAQPDVASRIRSASDSSPGRAPSA